MTDTPAPEPGELPSDGLAEHLDRVEAEKLAEHGIEPEEPDEVEASGDEAGEAMEGEGEAPTG